MSVEKPSLEEIINPRGIAIVGASPSVGKIVYSETLLYGLKEAGFPALYPVNPKYKEVGGLTCFASVRDIPGIVDHVILIVSATATLSLVDDCIAKGVKSIQLFTAGFSETGDAENARLEKELLKKASNGGIRIVGPNCVGFYVPKNRLTFQRSLPQEPGNIGFISQSGSHAMNLALDECPRGLRFSKIISFGNAVDIEACELMEYLARDEDCGIVSGYIEGVKDGKRFLKAIKEASKHKPVVILKGGTSVAGKRSTQSHTASLITSSEVFSAACRQANAIQVDDIGEMGDTLLALQFAKPYPKGIRAVAIGLGGGATVQSADEIEKAGLKLPVLPDGIQKELAKYFPVAGSIYGNPIDVFLSNPGLIDKTLDILAGVPDFDMIFFHMGFHPAVRWGTDTWPSDPKEIKPIVDVFKKIREKHGKPILLVFNRAADIKEFENLLAVQGEFAKAGLPVYYSFYKAAKAMARIIDYRQNI